MDNLLKEKFLIKRGVKMNNLKITIKNLAIKEFCGIKNYIVDIPENEKEFVAKNGSGKTSIKNAIYWVLGFNVSKFYPTRDNKEIPNLTPQVTMTLSVNGLEYELKRELITFYNENGYKTKSINKYYVDGIEYTEKNYKAKIASIFNVNSADTLEVLIDKSYFNSNTTKWSWKNRRELLLSMCDTKMINDKILAEHKEYEFLRTTLLKGTQPQDIIATIKKDKKEIEKNQITNNEFIKIRQADIDKLKEIDFKVIESQLNEKQAELDKLINKDKETQNNSDYETINKDYERVLVCLETSQERLSNIKWFLSNYETIVCPYCKEEFYIEQDNYDDYMQEKEQLENDIENLIPLKAELKEMLDKIEQNQIANNTNGLMQLNSIVELKNLLNKQDDMKEYQNAINDKQNENKKLANKLIECQKREMIINAFIKLQCQELENIVNSLFDNGITFTLFDIVNNNGEPKVSETCELIYDNKTYSVLSNGWKNYIDIEITKMLQNHFGINAFMIFDNAESVTEEIEIDNQLIKFIAQKDCEIEGVEKI